MSLLQNLGKIDLVPLSSIRHQNVGDWKLVDGVVHALVCPLGNADSEWLVGLHELLEARECLRLGILQEMVDDWDAHFEGDGEPGEHPSCPYYQAHATAMMVERSMASAMGVDWDAHEARIAAALEAK